MFDQVLALQEQPHPSRSGKPGPAGVTLSLLTGVALTQIAAWPEALADAGTAAAGAAGCGAAPGPGRAEQGTAGTLVRVEPLKWWLLQSAGHLPAAVQPGNAGTVLDLSSARTLVQVSGPQAETLLNHFLPLDLRPAAFPEGSAASTAFHHTGVTLWRTGPAFILALPRSFAASLWELLAGSALQYGLKTRETTFSPAPGDQE
ncbi:sarcosine oxidase subunit gamma [Leisingera sp. ANG-Vp]|uniref:sarcosine oxidase subunit gamma n=1 Tax=Leisingera sp. ANG-Vp TaxID=1577896 RepID=UPI00068D3778|nr:sarcosine oxidase subunit gamma family protein [Leisingera sp. ANG-Vp]